MEIANDPFVGKLAGKCRILERIGEGGTAYVYRAHNEAFQMDRVVKILKPELTADEDYYPKFKQEAQLVARLDHPHILRVFDTGMFEDHIYIEMEYIQGMTLREYMLRHGRLAEKQILTFALQIISALRYAHEVDLTTPEGLRVRGILHRDLKPENIMITSNKEIKLMDFGAAEALTVAAASASEGKIFGTLAYMSPEQISGLPLDVRSDFFSLGTILYELFTGRKTFPAEGLHDLIQQVKSGRYEPIRRLRRSISPLTEELIQNLLAVRPSHRPNTTADIEKDLKVCQQFYAIYGTGARVRVPFSVRKHLPLFSMALSSLALVIAVIALIRSGGDWNLNLGAAPSSPEAQVYLERGITMEEQGRVRRAITQYEEVPEGTLEYYEAQTRAASLYYTKLKQVTRARSMLEKLRQDHQDAYVDGMLGRVYYKMALYPEARQRMQQALDAHSKPVLPLTEEFRDDLRYYIAWSWDKEYHYLGKDARVLEEGVKSWSYYLDSRCVTEKQVKASRCQTAEKRKKALATVLKEESSE